MEADASAAAQIASLQEQARGVAAKRAPSARPFLGVTGHGSQVQLG